MNKEPNETTRSPRAPYQKPRLVRWGTLRELTLGGGGRKNEPSTKRDTRF